MFLCQANGPSDPLSFIKAVESGGMVAFAAVLLWAVVFKLPNDLRNIAEKIADRLDKLIQAIATNQLKVEEARAKVDLLRDTVEMNHKMGVERIMTEIRALKELNPNSKKTNH